MSADFQMLVWAQGHLSELQAMYSDWPFFQSTIDLIEMVRGLLLFFCPLLCMPSYATSEIETFCVATETVTCLLQILAKADMRIAAMYDQQLVTGEEERALGELLRKKFMETQHAVLQVISSACGRRWLR